jgi:transcriptional regulator with XRE-family HTH domain
MGRNVEDIIAGLPKQRRSKINQKARQMAGEMIAHADSLGAVRKAVSKTQSQMGEELGMPQNAISQLEKRSDLLVSTLARYVDALGAELDLVVRMKDGTEIVLAGLGRTAKKSAKKSPNRKKSTSRSDRKAA